MKSKSPLYLFLLLPLHPYFSIIILSFDSDLLTMCVPSISQPLHPPTCTYATWQEDKGNMSSWVQHSVYDFPMVSHVTLKLGSLRIIIAYIWYCPNQLSAIYYPTLPYPTLPYPTLPYPTVLYPVSTPSALSTTQPHLTRCLLHLSDIPLKFNSSLLRLTVSCDTCYLLYRERTPSIQIKPMNVLATVSTPP